MNARTLAMTGILALMIAGPALSAPAGLAPPITGTMYNGNNAEAPRLEAVAAPTQRQPSDQSNSGNEAQRSPSGSGENGQPSGGSSSKSVATGAETQSAGGGTMSRSGGGN